MNLAGAWVSERASDARELRRTWNSTQALENAETARVVRWMLELERVDRARHSTANKSTPQATRSVRSMDFIVTQCTQASIARRLGPNAPAQLANVR